MEVNADFVHRLSGLRSAFGDQLESKFLDLNVRWRQWVADPKQAGLLVDMRRAAHSLVGGGATFGFPAISDRARVLETFVKSVIAANESPDGEIDANFRFLFGELMAARDLPSLDPETWVKSQIEDVPESLSKEPNEVSPRVFIVDADRDSGSNLSAQLSHFGYTISHFTGLNDAEVALCEVTPSAIILEMELPEGSSSEFVANRLSNLLAGVPVFFWSRDVSFSRRLEAVRVGSRGFFAKPVDITALVDALDVATHITVDEPLRVLIVDDSPAILNYHAAILDAAGMKTRVLSDPLKTLEALHDCDPDLMLCDLYMPECSGFELAQVVRQEPNYNTLPIVFLSVEDNYDKHLVGLKEGGDDFLVKPMKPSHLVAAVVSRANRARVLHRLVNKDSLTGLLNHTAIKERLTVEISRAARQSSRLCAVMIDLDHFKDVNDQFGHSAGDRVIKSLARLLYQRLRHSDIVGRYGGEEFAVVLFDASPEQAFIVLEEVRQSFAQLIHLTNDGATFKATLSAGIASYPSYKNLGDLLGAADRALYLAKADGRNRVALIA